MIYKVLRRLGLGGSVLCAARPFLRAGALPSPDEAYKTLQRLSPDPGNSCLCERANAKSGEYELDIIVPAYNVEKYIKRCIDSVLQQETDCRWRLIVVDDGSKDASGSIIDSYAGDPRLLIIHQENRGFSGARNAGLERSDAEHIMFLDSDDALCPGAIEALMAEVRKGAAIAEGGFNSVDPEGRVLSVKAHKQGGLDVRRELEGFPWAKIYDSSLFDGICLPEGYWYEDSLMAQIIYPLAESRGMSARGIDQSVYNYTINPAGITANSRRRPKCIDSLWITMSLARDREKLGLEKDQAYFEYILNMVILSYRRAEEQSEETKKAMLVLWRDFIVREFAGFESGDSNKSILHKAVLCGNFALYSAACKLI